ncbi:MAG: hypothetical protein ABW157_15350 [Candidatus Thiodiazotropha sp. LLP2]
MIIEVAMRTDKGVVREQNEDAIGGDPDSGLLILADGMGGPTQVKSPADWLWIF